MASFTVPVRDAIDPLVLAMDVGSMGSRGGLYDAAGVPLAGGHHHAQHHKGRQHGQHRYRHKVPHTFTTGADGTSTIDPDQVVAELSQVIDVVLADPGLVGRVAAVAIDTFASSLIGLDRSGAALTPCYTYADSRAADQVDELRRELDEAQVQQLTGTRLHNSYLAPRLRWLARTGGDRGVVRWVGLGEYVYERLLGTSAAGTAVAAWTGLLDLHTGAWAPQLLAAAGIDAERLNPVHTPEQVLRPVDGRIAARWPALADAVWLPPIADGYAANLGSGVADPSSAVLSTATSGAVRVLLDTIPATVPPGLWCYRVDDRRCLLGGAINDVGRAVEWLRTTLALPGGADGSDEQGSGTARVPDPLAAALEAPPAATTPLVLPFLSGERSTGWQARARAVFTGVSAGSTPLDLWRGGVEGVALTYARVADQLATQTTLRQVRVGGGVQQGLPGLVPLLADVLGLPATPVLIKRVTLHGTALHALELAAPDVPRAPVLTGPTREPRPDHAAYYRQRLADFEQVYAALYG